MLWCFELIETASSIFDEFYNIVWVNNNKLTPQSGLPISLVEYDRRKWQNFMSNSSFRKLHYIIWRTCNWNCYYQFIKLSLILSVSGFF